MCFLSAVFTAALLLLSSTAAAPTPEECAPLTETLPAEELHTIFGKWIMHEAYIMSNHSFLHQLSLRNASSQTEFIPSENNQTVTLKRADMVDELCGRYSLNFTVVGTTIRYIHTSTTHNSTSEVDFLKTCDGCLMMRYTTTVEEKKTFLLFLKKTKTLLPTDQEKARKQAMCLGYLRPPAFTYKQAELCAEEGGATEAKEAEQ